MQDCKSAYNNKPLVMIKGESFYLKPLFNFLPNIPFVLICDWDIPKWGNERKIKSYLNVLGGVAFL